MRFALHRASLALAVALSAGASALVALALMESPAAGQTGGEFADVAPQFPLRQGATVISCVTGAECGESLPPASGGNPPLRYSLADPSSLPDGLSFATSTRAFSGAPTSVGQSSHTLRVTDVDGDSDTLAFSIFVAAGPTPTPTSTPTPTATPTPTPTATPTPRPDTQPSFGGQSIPDQTWTAGERIVNLQLPETTGGNGVPLYSLSPGLPDGVAREAQENIHYLYGTPSAAFAKTLFTWKS